MDNLDLLPGRPPGRLTEQRAAIVVFACGDPAHSEHDSIAIAACKGLSADVLERIDLKLTGALRPEYVRDLSPGTVVIIADTVPGVADAAGETIEIPFIELLGRELPLMTHSTPDQPLDEVIAMAELLREEPLTGRFIGLGLESIDLRSEPDPGAVETLRAAVAKTIVELHAT